MSQTPYGTNDYSAPNDTQAMYMGGQPGFSPEPQVAPDAEQKLKLSQMILLGNLAVYVLTAVATYLFITKPMMDVFASDPEFAELGLGGIGVTSALISTVIGVALYLLVYLLMGKRKKVGRILGFIFAGIGIASNLYSLTMYFTEIAIMALLVISIGLAIAWIIVAANKSVSTILR